MGKYQVEKVIHNKPVYIADIVEAESETQAIQKYINKIASYWGYCVFSQNDFIAKIMINN